ncbi:unnamed protein product, partial [Ectocarpus fasciculatus]
MKNAASRPFLVPSGARPLSDRYGSNSNTTANTTNNEGTHMPRRVSIAVSRRGTTVGRRASARHLTPGGPHRSRNRSEVSAANAAFVIPEVRQAGEEFGKGTAAGASASSLTAPRAAPRHSSSARSAGRADGATRRRPTEIRRSRGSLSRRGSTMKDILQQRGRLQPKMQHRDEQPERPAVIERNGNIQAERQARRNRALNFRPGGNFFGARDKSAQDLFRGISVLPGRHPLCSDDDSTNTGGNGLWTDSSCNEQDFLLSHPVNRIDWFVSHTWTRDRRDQMCRNLAEFTRLKAAELKEVLDEIAAEKRVIRRESQTHSLLDELLMQVPTDPIMLWIDKFCVSPDFLERRLVIERHMDYFLTNSDGFLVLLSSCYFRRLWCVYEWGCFVATHGIDTLDRVRVCLSWLCSSAHFQVPLVASDIETLSIADLKCSELNDQLYLRSVIANNYVSVQAFSRMVQVSAICAFTKCYAVVALDFCTPGHAELEQAWGVFNRHLRWRHTKFLLPWRSVAEKLGLSSVCSGLDKFWDQMQRSAKLSAEGELLQDGSDLYCVSAPPGIRLRKFANSAAQAHLAVLVRNARAAAVAAEAG